MKIVSRAEFLKLPANTVYTEYKPCYFGEMGIKVNGDDTQYGSEDFVVQDIADCVESDGSDDLFKKLELMEAGQDMPMDFQDNTMRDGLFDQEQMFAVWSKEDIKGLIERLNSCL